MRHRSLFWWQQAVNIIDTAMSMLKFPSGAICKIDASRSSVYGYDQRVEIYGSEGSVEVRGGGGGPSWCCLTDRERCTLFHDAGRKPPRRYRRA